MQVRAAQQLIFVGARLADAVRPRRVDHDMAGGAAAAAAAQRQQFVEASVADDSTPTARCAYISVAALPRLTTVILVMLGVLSTASCALPISSRAALSKSPSQNEGRPMGLTAAQQRRARCRRGRRSNAAAIARCSATPEIPGPRHGDAAAHDQVGQQVPFKAADSIWAKCAGIVGDVEDPTAWLARSDEELRAGGLSRQKIGYMQSLAHAIASGGARLRCAARRRRGRNAQLVAVKGIVAGRRRSICCFRKAAPTSGRRAIWRCSIETGASST